MAGREDQPQQIVADVVVEHGVEVRCGLRRIELVAQLLVLAIEEGAAPQLIDRTVFGRSHEPRARVVGNAVAGPLLEGRDERVLREILGKADVADDSREARDEFWRFDPPHGVDRAMGVGGRHRHPSHHRTTVRASCDAGL